MNADEVLKIIEAFRKSGLASLSWQDEVGELKLKNPKHPSDALIRGPRTESDEQSVSSHSSVLGLQSSNLESKTVSEVESEDEFERIVVKAPVVGVFFSAQNPDEDPFVEEGSVIEPGDVLCIIEAMKLMNEVVAEESGTIREILVSNGEKVEYGQELFILEPLKEG